MEYRGGWAGPSLAGFCPAPSSHPWGQCLLAGPQRGPTSCKPLCSALPPRGQQGQLLGAAGPSTPTALPPRPRGTTPGGAFTQPTAGARPAHLAASQHSTGPGSAAHRHRASEPAGIGQQKSVVLLGRFPAEPAPRPALPWGPRPAQARRERLRGHGPAPAAAPAQMPLRSWRVGTCLGAGAWAAAASPPPSRRCFPELPESRRAAGPSPPGAAESRRAVGRGAPGPGPAPCAASGGRRGERGGGGRRAAGTGGAAHARVAGERRRSAPSLPSPGRGRTRGGVRSAAPRRARKRKLLAGLGPSNFAAGGATRSCAGRSQGW